MHMYGFSYVGHDRFLVMIKLLSCWLSRPSVAKVSINGNDYYEFLSDCDPVEQLILKSLLRLQWDFADLVLRMWIPTDFSVTMTRLRSWSSRPFIVTVKSMMAVRAEISGV